MPGPEAVTSCRPGIGLGPLASTVRARALARAPGMVHTRVSRTPSAEPEAPAGKGLRDAEDDAEAVPDAAGSPLRNDDATRAASA